jgi:thiol:disulfide interchange protein DsbD
MRHTSALFLLVFLGGFFHASAFQGLDEQHTQVRLLAGVQSIQPGKAFLVGIRLNMDPGWHTYWKNSGEAGLPTRVDWDLPDGFQAGRIQWPLPEKHIESGDVLTYGYQGETMLLIPISTPASLQAGSAVTLRAEVHWLECKATCIPGSASLELVLPVTNSEPESDHEPLFRKYREAVPVPLSETEEITVDGETESGAIVLDVDMSASVPALTGEEFDFYPDLHEEIIAGRSQVKTLPSGARITVPLSAFQRVRGPTTIRGVVVYRTGGVVVEIPLSEEFCRTIPVEGEERDEAGLLDREFTTSSVEAARQPLYLYIIFAIVGGMILNIMPCVLPVIALKIFGLVKMAGDEPRKVKQLGWFFSFGILASFLVLAFLVILLQIAGQQVGWGFQFQEPLFVIAMSAIVFAFGLSLFGVYEIQLPSSAVASVSGMVSRQEGTGGGGYAASFFEGVFATILATPCTAPFLGSALGFAFSQTWWIILVIFTSVAFGMALPYLLLTARPAWLKFVPKPGEWMVTAKQFMGFLMMGTLLWLLYVLFLITVGISCWLIGRFATLSGGGGRSIVTWGAAIVIVVLGYVVFLESVLDVRTVIAGESSAAAARAAGDPEDIMWEPFSLATLEEHLDAGDAVFVDFTAEWCLTCKVNERTVLTDDTVVEKFRSMNIVAVKADWTKRNPDITRLLAKFGRSGVPLYVVFPAGRPRDPIVLPEVITPGIVIDALEEALDTSSRGVL